MDNTPVFLHSIVIANTPEFQHILTDSTPGFLHSIVMANTPVFQHIIFTDNNSCVSALCSEG